MEKTRVLLVDKDISVCRLFCDNIDPLGNIRVDTIYYEEDIAGCLSEIYYNLVIIDREMINESVIKSIIRNNPDPKRHPIDTEIILTSGEIERDTVVKIGKLKPMYLIKKPFDFAFIQKLIEQTDEMHRIKTQLIKLSKEQAEPYKGIDEILLEIGVPSGMNGYAYLETGLSAAMKSPALLEYITKDLYAEIAQTHKVTVAKVEKSIRDAITAAWNRGDADVFREYFGNTVSRKSGKPSNASFIKSVINKIKRDNPEQDFLNTGK